MMFEEPTRHEWKWLHVCEFSAPEFSTCAKRQYFATILSAEGGVCSVGYNGASKGLPHCVDGFCPRLQEDSAPGSSYNNCVAVHAERAALDWSDRTARLGGTILVNGPPCWDCSKSIAGSGLRRLVYIKDDTYLDWARCEDLLRAADIVTVGVNREDL